MLKQERYFHYQATNKARALGFSCLFTPSEEKASNGDQMVGIRITRANKNDKAFNKKIARTVLNDRPSELVRVRDIPYILCQAANHCEGKKSAYAVSNGDFCSVLRYFV